MTNSSSTRWSCSTPHEPSGTVCLYQSLEVHRVRHSQSGPQAALPLIEQVNNERITVEITSRRGNAVLISAEEFAAMRETACLLRVPANAKRLFESLQQALSGDR